MSITIGRGTEGCGDVAEVRSVPIEAVAEKVRGK
jgi:hypothetical protein